MVFASLFPNSFVVGFLSSAILPSLLFLIGELSYCLSFLAYLALSNLAAIQTSQDPWWESSEVDI